MNTQAITLDLFVVRVVYFQYLPIQKYFFVVYHCQLVNTVFGMFNQFELHQCKMSLLDYLYLFNLPIHVKYFYQIIYARLAVDVFNVDYLRGVDLQNIILSLRLILLNLFV